MPSDIEERPSVSQKWRDLRGFYVAVAALSLIGFVVFQFSDELREQYVQLESPRHSYASGSSLGADVIKRDAIVETFKYAWNAYETDAMGFDEFHPISHKGSNISPTSTGVGYTVLDALDTIHIMGLRAEYSRARHWVKKKLSFDQEGVFSTFETTIRVLGGLLSTYHLTSDRLYLDRAVDLGDRLMTAFDTSTGLPFPSVNLGKRVGVPDQWSAQMISTAEVTTLQLEFKELSRLTNDTTYWYAAEKAMEIVAKAANQRVDYKGLVPIFMNMDTGSFTQSDIRLGSRGDSYYEYLLKQYLQTAKTEGVYKTLYEESMQSLHDHIVQKSVPRGMTYIAELIPARGKNSYTLSPKQDHLVCFLAGSLMLGAVTSHASTGMVSIPPKKNELTKIGWRDWETGKELLETCVATYSETRTGLSPEIAMFRTEDDPESKDGRDWYIKNWKKNPQSQTYDARYMLRPETVESIFIAYRLTGDERYRTYAWNIYNAIERFCRIPTGGYATVLDVDAEVGSGVGRDGAREGIRWEDKQETFFLSETLKYLFLTFEDGNVLPLDEYVFNTEAHPLPIFKPTIKPRFV